MFIGRKTRLHPEAGTTLLEVLITIVILAFGLLGLAGLQAKIHLAEVESYQRAEALVLLRDMVERMQSYDPAVSHADYDTSSTCATPDQCEWLAALQGAAEKKAGVSVGAMTNAHGCITQLQAPVVVACAPPGTVTQNTPGIYLVTVTWSGMHQTAAPSSSCTGDTVDGYLRSVSARVSLGIAACT